MIESFIRSYSQNYAPHRPGRWCYEDGCFFKGLADLHEATGEAWYLAQLVEHVNRWIHPDGAIDGFRPEEYCLDDVNAGKVLFALRDWTGDRRYEQALHLQRDQLRTHPRTNEGNFWHKKTYPWQVWLDGIYMALPLLVRYGLEYGEEEAVTDAFRQVGNVRRLMRDPATGLYYHGYDESRRMGWADRPTGLSRIFWSRAIAWYAMALVDILELMPAGHMNRAFYARLLAELCQSMLPWQQKDGLWMQVTDQADRPGNYPESSASAMLAYSFLKGHRLGVLDARFAAGGRAAFEGIVATCLADGKLGGICRSAGLGPLEGQHGDRDGSFEYYVGEPIVANDPKGVGPFMMTIAELTRAQQTVPVLKRAALRQG